mgnify:CR=1 FL=1
MASSSADTPAWSPMAARIRTRSTIKLPPWEGPSGATAGVSRSRRINPRMAGETTFAGSFGSNDSTSGRGVPCHIRAPRPPSASVSVPALSKSRVLSVSTRTSGPASAPGGASRPDD